ncbi:hypothetical protein EYF80_061324 [Liparis tanakae]|uniref:Uncharacterized protein n=1 Tax=Liparis tanakae TaxID=230148 RepID=A0A4Z2EIF0_9TELE|nr:hypothetical protein EYF80_061324 [Liparis tanakae]
MRKGKRYQEGEDEEETRKVVRPVDSGKSAADVMFARTEITSTRISSALRPGGQIRMGGRWS